MRSFAVFFPGLPIPSSNFTLAQNSSYRGQGDRSREYRGTVNGIGSRRRRRGCHHQVATNTSSSIWNAGLLLLCLFCEKRMRKLIPFVFLFISLSLFFLERIY